MTKPYTPTYDKTFNSPIKTTHIYVLLLSTTGSYYLWAPLFKILIIVSIFVLLIKILWSFLAPSIDASLAKHKWYRKLKYFLKFDKIKRQAKSLNH